VGLERLVIWVRRVPKIYVRGQPNAEPKEVHDVRVLYCFSISFTTCSQLLRSDPGVPSPFIQHSRARIGSFGTERDRLVVAVAGSGVPELLAREDSRVLMA
jgi:hypothetical protein